MRKVACDGDQKITRPGGDDLPFVYSGTMLLRGRGVARVVATGQKTEFGKIGKALESVEQDETFLQKRSGTLIRNFAAAGICLCILVVALYGPERGKKVQYAEAFQLGQYGRQASADELKKMFPIGQ